MNVRKWGVLLLLMMCSTSITARADDKQQENQRCVDAMSDEDVEQWLRFVDDSFSDQRLGAALWFSGWSAFNVFNIAFGAERYATAHKRLAKDNWLVSIIGAGLFVTSVSALPMPGLYGYRRLSRLPQHNAEQKRAKLVQGLRLLDKSALVETSNSDVWAHVAVMVYAIASTAYVWVRNTDAPKSRLWLGHGLQFGTSVAFGEATLWTVPRRARRDLQRIRRSGCAPVTRTPALSFDVGLTGLSLRF